MEELVHRVVTGGVHRVAFQEGRPHEPPHGGAVARQADGAHALPVGGEGNAGGKAVFRRRGGKGLVAGQVGQLHREGRVVGEHAHRVLVKAGALGGDLQHQRAGAVGNVPVQRGQRITRREGDAQQVDALQHGAGFLQGAAAAQHQRNQLIGGHRVRRGLFGGSVVGVAGEVQPGHVQPGLVHGLGVQGHAPGHGGHADHGQMVGHRRAAVEVEGEGAGRCHHLLAEGRLQIQIAAEQRIGCGKSDACAHKNSLLAALAAVLGGCFVKVSISHFRKKSVV